MTLSFSYEHARVPEEELAALLERLSPELERLRSVSQGGYEDERSSVNLPFDEELHARSLAVARECAGAALVVVVGIGGSNLGTLAVFEAVRGALQLSGDAPRVLFADTVDARRTGQILQAMEEVMGAGGRVLVIGVSKSGGTMETIANFEVVLERHRAGGGRPEDVVVISGEGSGFWRLAVEEGFRVLPIPATVGGRFSVLSPVGVFPLAVLGIETGQLLEGARQMRDACLRAPRENPAALSAAVLAYHAWHGRPIADLFVFSPDLEGVGKWYRQLLAESVGKEFDRAGRRVLNGVTPTVSVGSTDLHSMAQLYLGGPQTTFTTFVFPRDESPVRVPSWDRYASIAPQLQGRSFTEVMQAIFSGVTHAFVQKERPFCTVELPDKSAWNIGNFLQFKMMEVMFLGSLMGVNVFDQPAVELYKQETRRLLESAGQGGSSGGGS